MKQYKSIYFFSNRMGIMGCLLGLAVFPATAVSLARCPTTAMIRGSVTVCQEWLERSVIAVLMAFTHSRMVAAHVSSNPRSSQSLSGISFSNILYVELWQRSLVVMTIRKNL